MSHAHWLQRLSRTVLTCGLVTAMLLPIGCAGEKKKDATPEAETTQKTDTSENDTPLPPPGGVKTPEKSDTSPQETSRKSTYVSTGKPINTGRPVEAVQNAFLGIESGNIDGMWQSLPSSYRKDVNELVQMLAEKMDPELYDEVFKTLQTGVNVLETKKKYVMTAMAEQNSVPISEEDRNTTYDGSVEILKLFVNSEISSVDKLKTFQGAEFADQTLGKILAKAKKLSELESTPEIPDFDPSKLKFELVSEEGDKATVRVIMPDQKPDLYHLVNIEGHWLPAEAAQWDQGMQQARQAISGMNRKQIAEFKPFVMPVLKRINASLNSLEKADSQEEFNQAAGEMMANLGPVMQMARNMIPGMGPPEFDLDAEEVYIGINRQITEDEGDRLMDAFQSAGFLNTSVVDRPDTNSLLVIALRETDKREEFLARAKEVLKQAKIDATIKESTDPEFDFMLTVAKVPEIEEGDPGETDVEKKPIEEKAEPGELSAKEMAENEARRQTYFDPKSKGIVAYAVTLQGDFGKETVERFTKAAIETKVFLGAELGPFSEIDPDSEVQSVSIDCVPYPIEPKKALKKVLDAAGLEYRIVTDPWGVSKVIVTGTKAT